MGEHIRDRIRRLERELAEARAAAGVKRMQQRGNRSPLSVWIVRKKVSGHAKPYQVRWIDPMDHGQRGQACESYADARALRDDVRAKLREGLWIGGAGHTLSELRVALAVWMAGKSPETIQKTQKSVELLQDVVGDRRLPIDRAAIMEFRASRLGDTGRGGTKEKPRKLSPATLNKNLRELSSAFSYAKTAGWMNQNPLLEWTDAKLVEPQRIARTITAEQLRAINKATPEPILRVAWILALCQGMRRRELHLLQWPMVDLTRLLVEIVNYEDATTKSKKCKALPLHPWAAAELAKVWKSVPKVIEGGREVAKFPQVLTRPDGRHVTQDELTRAFIRAARAAGVKATLHDLRRSFSTLARNAGVDKGTVQELGRWTDPKTMDGYYTGDVQPALRQAMDRIASVIRA